jgi:glyoxylase-like metal-dependent hydrolase (beta-lactamase superfamily II)
MITLPLPFRLNHVNVYALIYDGKVALFDTGIDLHGTLAELDASLKTIGHSIQDIELIFLTHFHADHCGIAGKIKKISNATIHMSQVDYQSMLNRKDTDLFSKRLHSLQIRQGVTGKTADMTKNLFIRFAKATAPFEADRFLRDQQKVSIGNTSFEVILTPGHTRGHICFFFQKERLLLSGDHILPGIIPTLIPDPCAPDFSLLHSFLDSLPRIQDMLVEMVYPAHGAPFSNLDERIKEIKEYHRLRSELILDSLKGGSKTTFEVSLDIFGRDLSESEKYQALNETYAHLTELERLGIIKEDRQEKQHLFTANTSKILS